MIYKIDKDIPVPAGGNKYPFAIMEIGDSIFFPAETTKTINGPRAVASMHGKKYGKKFRTLLVDGGFRIWRVEAGIIYEIDKDIPIPAGGNKYPFAIMEIGDSIFVPADAGGSPRQAAYKAGYKYDRKFFAKIIGSGIRIWRVG